MSFDWQELPEGYVNLTTTRPYTLAETRDLLNRQLLARGFTMLTSGDVLTAVKIDKLDPSLIPTHRSGRPGRLSCPTTLSKSDLRCPRRSNPPRRPRTSRLLLSPHAKVMPLLTTRRLLVIDAVANLRDVRDLLYAEQSAVREDVRPQRVHD